MGVAVFWNLESMPSRLQPPTLSVPRIYPWNLLSKEASLSQKLCDLLYYLEVCFIFYSLHSFIGTLLIFVSLQTIVGIEHSLLGSSVRPSVRPSVRCLSVRYTILRDAVSLQLLEWFQWNLAQVFTVGMGIAERFSRSWDQRSRSYCTSVWMLKRRRHTFRRRGVDAHLFKY